MLDLTIGAVAKSAGVGVETIRFYERQHLIEQPPKPSHGFRHYSASIVKRVRFIQQAKELGFSLREIRELLDLSLDPGRNCNEVRELAERCYRKQNSDSQEDRGSFEPSHCCL